MSLTLAGDLSCSRLRVKYSLCPRSEARVESHEILFMVSVSSDADVAALYGDEESHEEASERKSTVPAEIRPEAFKRPLLIHRNTITTGWKRVGRVSRDHSKARDTILEEFLAKNVSPSLHNSFCLNR